jgi:hypothetical protein
MSHEIPDMKPWLISAIMSERARNIKRIKDIVCFDALHDEHGRCSNHGGKCFELLELIAKMEREKPADVE